MSKTSSFPPVYNHEFQQASEHLRRTLPLVNQHQTPVNPVNYAVWYEYVSGDNTELTNAIDTRLNKKDPITAEVIQYLYEKYVLMGMPERLDKTNNGLKLVVDNTLENINRAEATASHCTSGLTNSQSLLESCNDVQQLKSLVSEILSNTQKLTSTSSELKQELVRSTEEITKLRRELEAVKETARTDGLTGLLNRGAFNRELQLLCNENDITMSLALFDIDHFKRINDTFGHLLGDKVLQYFAAILNGHRDDIHIAARFGGEEMAMIFVHSSEQETFRLAESIRQEFASSRLKKKGSNESIGQVTVSAGISTLQAGDTPQTLVDRADQALYKSKADGRNRTNFF
ncbi:GGDEF domain-containing protein [Methylophaga sp. OBS4]|uniref:GGDEF domain-containing protein n=1 Tax=Methylophaga sp. OBS4 TaxID=2991935 RepID=UPI00225A8846|nr:GGDEF domain-containing protein [Methylophaga sp. OBS4]MCX4188550.1 GGDEF domain-containing protein [Methylophaga sp. OBS4]